MNQAIFTVQRFYQRRNRNLSIVGVFDERQNGPPSHIVVWVF